MRAICRHNHGSQLSADEMVTQGMSSLVSYDLTIGDEYEVYGIANWADGSWHYLVVDEVPGERPSWYPAVLFTIVDGRIPVGWEYAYFGARDWPRVNSLAAVIGYTEITSPGYFDALQDRDRDALSVFETRRRETDAWRASTRR